MRPSVIGDVLPGLFRLFGLSLFRAGGGVTMRGTHRGEWMGLRPTGRTVEVTAVNVDRVVDGLIVEHGGAANLLEPLLEVGATGVVSAPGE